MSATLTNWPATTAAPGTISVPVPGSVVIFTAWNWSAGVSRGSVKPKSARATVYGVSSNVVTVFGVPTGASLTAVTFTVSWRGVGSTSTPPFAVPPLSCTWKVKLAYGVPLASAAGASTSRPASMSPTLTNWPATTAAPRTLSVPVPGSVVIFTAWKALGGVSWGSVKPKSARANVYAVSSSVVTVVAVPTGASLTGVTFTVSARGVGSRSTPPLAVPPLSCTWNVKLAYGAPFASAAGVNTSRPASMSPTLTNWPATTAAPRTLSVPVPGSVATLTAWKPLAGVSWGSVKPKSARANVYGVSSSVVTVFGVPTGASLTGVTFTVSGRGVGSRSTPPFAVPPLSCTWNVKLAYARPLASAAGVNTSPFASRSPTLTNCPAATAVPLSLSVPAPGSVVTSTASKALAGLSWGSVNPKSARANAYGVSSSVVTVVAVPTGASLTGVTFTVRARGVGSRSTPPLAVPPLSCTWNVKLV